ncbi:uncharacterized protein [Watersipora subatra]|uniref:uncharacterized protein n=1 Tax=Watersipora subatra TaxID=2589382 RepID=UPI00355C5191
MPNGTINVIEEVCKYLGIMQSNINHEAEVRHKAITKCKKCLWQVLWSQLNAKNQVTAINTYALPAIRYPSGIIKWTEEAIKETDITTRKLLTMHGALHPKSDTTKLYLNKKDGDKLLAEFHSADLSMDLRRDDEEIDCHTKPLHGAYHRQISKVGDFHQTYMWLNKGNLTANTESLIMTAHEQVLPTRQLQTKIYHTRDDPRCRLCNNAPETIQHIISGCKQLARNAYAERHNCVAGVVYRSLCDEYGLNKPQRCCLHPLMMCWMVSGASLLSLHLESSLM